MLWEEKILFTVWVARTQDFNFIEWQLSSVFKYAHFDIFPKEFDIFVVIKCKVCKPLLDKTFNEPSLKWIWNFPVSQGEIQIQQKMKIFAI